MKKTLVVFLALLCMGTLAYADSFQVFNSRADQNPSDIIDWGQLGAPGTNVNSPANVQSFNGLNATVSEAGPFFTAMQQGVTWNGNFDFGENLLWTGNPNFNGGGPGPITINFASGVASVGFAIQADFFGSFTATLQLYNGNTLLYTLIGNGNSNSNDDGSALFMGVGDLSGNNITSIVISESDANAQNDFAIDAISLTTIQNQGVPEPGSMALLGSGLLTIAGVLRRKLGR